MKNCADNILILFYFLFLRKKSALSWPSEKNPLAKRSPSEKVTFAKRSPVAGQNCTIPRRPPNRDKRRRLSRFHAYSDVALKPTLIRRYKVYLSYKVGLATTNAANAPSVLGTPVYSPFLKLETFINSQNIETVTQYNQVCQAWMQCNLSVADKAGLQSAHGYRDTEGNDTLLSMFDHHLCKKICS